MPSQNYHAVLDRIADALERLAFAAEASRPVPYWPTYPSPYPHYTVNTPWPATITCSVDSSGTNG